MAACTRNFNKFEVFIGPREFSVLLVAVWQGNTWRLIVSIRDLCKRILILRLAHGSRVQELRFDRIGQSTGPAYVEHHSIGRL